MRSLFEIACKRCNSKDGNSAFEAVVGELRATLLRRGGGVARVRIPHHVRGRICQNVDSFSHNRLFSPSFTQWVCTLAATPPQTVISPPPNGGNGVIRTTTRRQLASNAAKPPPSPAWRAPSDISPEGPAGAEGAGEIGRPGGGARRTRCPWAAGPGRTTSQSADRSSQRGRLAVRTAEAGGTDTTASQISHAIPPQHESTQAQKP